MELEAPRQPLFPLVESSLSMTASPPYGVRGISRREAVRPLGRMAKGEGRESPCPDAVIATTAEVMQKHCYNIDRVSRALSYCVICLCKISSGLHFRRPLLVAKQRRIPPFELQSSSLC